MDVVRTQRKIARRSSPMKQIDTDGPPRRRLPFLRRRRHRSEPPPPRRHKLLEDHYRVDCGSELPGVPQYEADFARDSHECFNLVALVPVVLLDVLNWDWDRLWNSSRKPIHSIADLWTGEWFDAFFLVTALYFIIDLLWILAVPRCVKSPSTIVQHHLATLLYIVIPYVHSSVQWGMGACLMVEINTWFLIARRLMNRQGFSPWTIDVSCLSVRVKRISICFYTTWIVVRCGVYPALLIPFFKAWQDHSAAGGTPLNLIALCFPLHSCFCILNMKWTYDLLMSKIRYWQGQKAPPSKGL